MKMHVQVILKEPLYDAWLHTVVNYKYTTYRKYAIELWENMCSWISGRSRSFVLDWSIGKVLKYTNLNHSCPYIGHVYCKIDNISTNHFPIEYLLPSGRYRVDLNVTEGDRKTVLVMAQLFLSISDHRTIVV